METVNQEVLHIFNNLLAIHNDNFLNGVVGEERIHLLENHVRDVFQGVCTDEEQLFQPNLSQFPMKIQKAIQLYAGSGFTKVNDFLRQHQGYVKNTGEKLRDLNLATFETENYELDGVIDSLDFIIDKYRSDSDFVFFRGCSLEQFQNLGISSLEELETSVGKSFVEHSFLSTSSSLGGQFTVASPVVLAIHVPAGSHFLPMDSLLALKGEKEVLLERETMLSIGGAEKIGDQYFVYMRSAPLEKQIVNNIRDIHLTDQDESLQLSPAYDDDYESSLSDMLDEEENFVDSSFRK